MLGLALWYMWHTFINGIKRAWKVVAAMIGIFALCLVIGIVVGTVVDKYVDDGETSVSEEEEEENHYVDLATYVPKGDIEFVETEDGLYFIENFVPHNVGNLIISIVVYMLALLFIGLGIMGGAKNGASIFLMPDINFLFPSPNRPQSVLMFRMIGQIGTAMLGGLYIMFQMPNLVGNAGLPIRAAVIMVIAYIVLQLVSKMVSVFTYVAFQNHPKIKKFLSKYGLFVMVLPAIAAVVLKYLLGWGYFDSVNAAFTSTAAISVPFCGWLTASCIYAVEGEMLLSIMMLVVTLVGTGVLMYVTWQIPCDFYEDALASATEIANIQEAAQNVAAGGTNFGVSHEGKADAKKWEKRRNRAVVFDGYEGAKVFFGKTMLNRKRMHPLGGLYSTTCSFYLWMMVGLVGVMKYLANVDDGIVIAIIASVATLMAMFFRSFMNPLQAELSQNFIYMIPEKPSALLGWGMLGQMVDGAIDLIPASIVLGIGIGDPLLTVLLYLLFVSMHLFFGMTALVVNLVVANYLPIYISNMLQSLIRAIPFLPVAVIFIIGISSTNYVVPLLICIAINVAASMLAFWPCPYHLHKGKR